MGQVRIHDYNGIARKDMVDYTPAERSKYIEAFFANIDWDAVEQRIASPSAVRAAA